ncbi:MAG: DNA-directed RNA polymerase subunit alpha C-terminal domain-containing protein [Patescibacteria group bacterium]
MNDQERLLQIQMWEEFVAWIKNEKILTPEQILKFDAGVQRFLATGQFSAETKEYVEPGFLKEERHSGMFVPQSKNILDMSIDEFITRERMGSFGARNFVRVRNWILCGASEEERNLTNVYVRGGLLKPTRDHRCPLIKTVRDLTNCRISDLLNMPNFGKKCLSDVRRMLAEVGLKLKGD